MRTPALELTVVMHRITRSDRAAVGTLDGGGSQCCWSCSCVCSSACWVYRRQRSDEFQRTRTLSSQLHLSQRKVQQLEAELTRSRSSSVSNSLATEFFCGI